MLIHLLVLWILICIAYLLTVAATSRLHLSGAAGEGAGNRMAGQGSGRNASGGRGAGLSEKAPFRINNLSVKGADN